MKKLIAGLALFYCNAAFSQTIITTAAAEKKLVVAFKALNHWVSFKDASNKDSLQEANRYFRESLLAVTSTDPASLTYDFKALEQEGLKIASSEDKTFRIYSWPSGGGTARFGNIYQYKIGNKVTAVLKEDVAGAPGYWYSEVYPKKAGGKNYYIGISNATYSEHDTYQGIRIFATDRNGLNDTLSIIKTDKQLSPELGFTYDINTVAKKRGKPVDLIEYDDETGTLTFPDVAEDGTVKNKKLKYRFVGRYFVNVKE
ncbi:hypothetical protein SAMN04488505_101182 [Chitinophaga rupis]|uniref:Uncharacterized protein n=1 Tax=Chitinophaga rupis TaxID=573321 RepID=A0A1H7H1X3_9BACT|nr:hypothetical protein [Chitinophaga rupis]SEK42920.1 hypothetical protein SAMN04488505_101182 [Chitinophaga rupis]